MVTIMCLHRGPVARDRLQHRVALLRRLARQRRPRNVVERKLGVRHPVEEIAQERQPADRLVVEIDQRPRRERRMRLRQHFLARIGVVVIVSARLDIDRRKLPSLHRIVDAVEEPVLLHVLVATQPIFDEQDAVVGELALELGNRVQERVGFLRRAEPHDFLDARAIVPAAIEQDDLALGRKMLDVALEVPLAPFALGRRGKRHHAALPRVQHPREHVDRAALACRVAPFEHDHQPLPCFRNPARHRAELLRQRLQKLLVVLLAQARSAAHPCPRLAKLNCGTAQRRWEPSGRLLLPKGGVDGPDRPRSPPLVRLPSEDLPPQRLEVSAIEKPRISGLLGDIPSHHSAIRQPAA